MQNMIKSYVHVRNSREIISKRYKKEEYNLGM